MTDFLDVAAYSAPASGAAPIWGPFDFGTYAGNSATFRAAWGASASVWDLDATYTLTSTGAVPRADMATAGSLGINPTLRYTVTGLAPSHFYRLRWSANQNTGAGSTGWNPGTSVTVMSDPSGNVAITITLVIAFGHYSPLGHVWIDNVRLIDATTWLAVRCAVTACAMEWIEDADRERAFDGTARKTSGGSTKRVWHVTTVPLTASELSSLKSAITQSLTSAKGDWLAGSTVAVWPSEAKETEVLIGSGPETSLTFTLTEA